mgnify:CR=1 FL=1
MTTTQRDYIKNYETLASKVSKTADRTAGLAGIASLAALALTGAWMPVAGMAVVKYATSSLRYAVGDNDKNRLAINAANVIIPGVGYVAEPLYSAWSYSRKQEE